MSGNKLAHSGALAALGLTILFAAYWKTAGDDAGILALLGILSVAGYLAPTIIAVSRKHPQIGQIIVVNLLLGWTVVGYVVALAWSVSVWKK